jgi:hypothetical protein
MLVIFGYLNSPSSQAQAGERVGKKLADALHERIGCASERPCVPHGEARTF